MTHAQDVALPPSPTIVVVDDDEEIRDLLGEHLRRAGFGVAALADGRGLDEALLRQAAVVILDVMLPGEMVSACAGASVAAWTFPSSCSPPAPTKRIG